MATQLRAFPQDSWVSCGIRTLTRATRTAVQVVPFQARETSRWPGLVLASDVGTSRQDRGDPQDIVPSSEQFCRPWHAVARLGEASCQVPNQSRVNAAFDGDSVIMQKLVPAQQLPFSAMGVCTE